VRGLPHFSSYEYTTVRYTVGENSQTWQLQECSMTILTTLLWLLLCVSNTNLCRNSSLLWSYVWRWLVSVPICQWSHGGHRTMTPTPFICYNTNNKMFPIYDICKGSNPPSHSSESELSHQRLCVCLMRPWSEIIMYCLLGKYY